jgi:hypothetical protein
MPRPLSVNSRHTAVVVHTQVQLDVGGVGVTADVGQTLANDGEQVERELVGDHAVHPRVDVALGREAERGLGRRADLLDLAGEAARPGWLTRRVRRPWWRRHARRR